jgi:HSP20 family protein
MLGISKKDQNGTAEPRPTSPALDVYENDSEFLLIADLPGVAQGGAEVTLDRDRLVVSANGARKFRRELVVPPSVDGEKVAASMKAGVLTVHLPKRAPYQPRQIQVQSA